MCAVFCEFGAEIGALKPVSQRVPAGTAGVGPADHLEFEIGDDAGEGDRRMREEGAVAEAAQLFGAEEGEDDGAVRAGASGKDMREGEYGGGAEASSSAPL